MELELVLNMKSGQSKSVRTNQFNSVEQFVEEFTKDTSEWLFFGKQGTGVRYSEIESFSVREFVVPKRPSINK